MGVIVDPNGPRLAWSLLNLARANFILIDAFSQMTVSCCFSISRLLACVLGSQVKLRPFCSAASEL